MTGVRIRVVHRKLNDVVVWKNRMLVACLNFEITSKLNPCRAEFIWGNIKTNLHFLLLLKKHRD